MEVGTCENGGSIVRDITNFQGFKVNKVLMESAERKLMAIQGTFEQREGDDGATAIVILEKSPFAADKIADILTTSSKLEQQFRNDIYGLYDCFIPSDLNPTKANVIWPATQKHIDKWTSSPTYMIEETPALYNCVVLPFIESEQFNNDWIRNLLEHKKETERIIYEDSDPETGFILAPDYKWNGEQIENLYCLAIVHKYGIKSIRDLTSKHLPLLRKLYIDAPKAIHQKYGIALSQLRIYLHYQPSYYHLHVHYSALQFQAPGINCGKAHMLSTVIKNIERQSNYYARETLPFYIIQSTKMFGALEKAGYDFQLSTKTENGSVTTESNGDVPDLQRENYLKFFYMLGNAKHEPCGEHWMSSYGDSAWRMAIMSMCLPTGINRKLLVKVALSSALTSLGNETDENSGWKEKLIEVRQILMDLLPLKQAAKLYDLFLIHVNARRGIEPTCQEDRVYRKILELEESLLIWEELQKEGDPNLEQSKLQILDKMVQVGFPGHEKYTMFRDTSDFGSLLTFFIRISGLQRLQRTGWVRAGVRDPERVSGHMFRMGIMAILLEDQEAEADDKILGGSSVIVSIIHDLAECIVGDITPSDPVSPEEKHEKELEAMKSLVKDLPCSTHTREIFDAFMRYENQAIDDKEARLTKDLDRFDMVVQAMEYEEEKRPKAARLNFLQDFFDSTDGYFKNDTVRSWDKKLREIRNQRLQNSL